MTQLNATVGSPKVLADEQTIDGDSDNILFRKYAGKGPVGLVVTNVAGGSPTTTFSIKGSSDGINWYNVPYALQGTPSTFVVSDITLTTSGTRTYLLQADQPWLYLKTVMASTNNETVTVTACP